jgi:hypothetical protein
MPLLVAASHGQRFWIASSAVQRAASQSARGLASAAEAEMLSTMALASATASFMTILLERRASE